MVIIRYCIIVIYGFLLLLFFFSWYYIIATIGFISELVPKSRKILAVYPIVLFYMVLGWLVLMHPPLSIFDTKWPFGL